MSSCHDVSNHPLIDAVEVYARPFSAGADYSMQAGILRGAGPALKNVASVNAPSALEMKTVDALGACSQLLSHTLALARTPATPGIEETVEKDDPMSESVPTGMVVAEDDPLLRKLEDSALSVLCKTCLAPDAARWHTLRASSRSLLAAAQPDAALREERTNSAYVAEVILALAGGTGKGAGRGADGGPGGGVVRTVTASLGGEGRYPTPALLLTRVAQLCRRVCDRRSDLLRDELAPALISDGVEAGLRPPGSRFVFPALVQRFWESSVWRRDGRDGMQTVLRPLLRLAVHEMRAAAAAATERASGLSALGVTPNNSSSEGKKSIEKAEKDVLRSGLGELMPLLRSDVARVSQLSSSFLATLLVGAPPSSGKGARRVSSRDSSASKSQAASGRKASDAAGSRIAGNSGGKTKKVAGGASGATAYAPSAGSGSDAEGRVETEATSDPGSESDADPQGNRHADDKDGVTASDGTAVGLAVAELCRAEQFLASTVERAAAGGGTVRNGDGNKHASSVQDNKQPPAGQEGQPARQQAFDLVSASPMADFQDLLPASRKRARPGSSSSPSPSLPPSSGDIAPEGGVNNSSKHDDQDGEDEGGRTDMDVADGGKTAVNVRQSSSTGTVAAALTAVEERGGTARAAAPPTAGVGATAAAKSGAPGPAIATAVASKVCYRCDGCDDFPLQHVRHHCLVCADFDLCPRCFEVFHGPGSQFQGGNAIMLGTHSTAHGMVALQVSEQVFFFIYLHFFPFVL